MSRIQIEREEDGVRKGGAQSLDDEERIVGICAQNPDGPGALAFFMNARDERPDIIDLAGAFRPISRRILALIGGRLGGTRRSGRIVPGDFSIQAAEIAVAEHVEGE